MRLFRSIMKPFNTSSRFNRYYGSVLRSGEGYPTADEAKRDLRSQELNKNFVGWMH